MSVRLISRGTGADPGWMHVMLSYVDCGFCGAKTDDGWVSVQGSWWLDSGDTSLVWESARVRTMKRRWRDIGRRGYVTLLAGRVIRRSERAATLCRECGAVVIEPLSVADEEGPEDQVIQ